MSEQMCFLVREVQQQSLVACPFITKLNSNKPDNKHTYTAKLGWQLWKYRLCEKIDDGKSRVNDTWKANDSLQPDVFLVCVPGFC